MEGAFTDIVSRRMVILTGLTAMVGAVPFVNWTLKKPYDSDVIATCAHPVLLSLIAGKNDILQIGQRVWSSLTGSLTARDLTTIILKGIPIEYYQHQLRETELKLEILKKIQKEFQMGQIEVVDGWILSKTEVIQCGILSLLNKSI